MACLEKKWVKYCTFDKLSLNELTIHHPPCRNFVYQLRRISGDAGMLTKEPFFLRYVTGVDSVEPIFRQLKQDRPDLQLIMVVLPGKTPIYGEGKLVAVCQ